MKPTKKPKRIIKRGIKRDSPFNSKKETNPVVTEYGMRTRAEFTPIYRNERYESIKELCRQRKWCYNTFMQYLWRHLATLPSIPNELVFEFTPRLVKRLRKITLIRKKTSYIDY